MRDSIQQVHSKEEEAQAFFRYSKTPEKPVSNECIRQKSPAKRIKGKQTRQFCDHLLACGRDVMRRSLRRRFGDLNCSRGEGVKDCANYSQESASKKHSAVGGKQ